MKILDYFHTPEERKRFPIATGIMRSILGLQGLCLYCGELTDNQNCGEWTHKECQEAMETKWRE